MIVQHHDMTSMTLLLPSVGKSLAIDCEFVGVGPGGTESVLARCSLVNHHGFCVYDKFVQPREQVTDYRTFVSGVRPRDLRGGKLTTLLALLDCPAGIHILWHEVDFSRTRKKRSHLEFKLCSGLYTPKSRGCAR